MKSIPLNISHPHLVVEWHPDNPPIENYSKGSTKHLWWKCVNAHEWQAQPNNRTNRKSGCPYCSKKKAWPGESDLATLRPDIANEWHPENDLSPSEVTEFSGKSVKWLCQAGHSWNSVISNRTCSGNGCPVCSGLVAETGVTDFATVADPEVLAQWSHRNSIDPSTILPHSAHKVWWICSKGHEWKTLISVRTRGFGCPKCADRINPLIERLIHQEFSKYTESILHYETPITWDRGRSANSKFKVDLFLPKLNTIIEYDGKRWHDSAKRREGDIYKSNRLLEAGYRVVRFRENKLPHLNFTAPNFSQFDFIWSQHPEKVSQQLKPILDFLQLL